MTVQSPHNQKGKNGAGQKHTQEAATMKTHPDPFPDFPFRDVGGPGNLT